MSKLRRVSDQVHLSVFDAIAQKHTPLEDREPEMRARTQRESAFDKSFEELSESPKLSHNSIDEIDIVRGRHSIRSANCGNISDEGSSSNAHGVAGKNSLFDPALLDRLSTAKTNKERTLSEKSSTNKMRADKESEYRSNQLPKMGEDDEAYLSRQASSVVSNSQTAHRHGWVPQGTISIFDNKDFERVKPTLGESLQKKEAKQDNSWQQIKKASSIKDETSNLFNKLSDNTDDSSYKNLQKESTDRIFDVLQSRLNSEGE